MYDPEVELVRDSWRCYRGHAGVRQAWDELRRADDARSRFGFDEIRDLGESVLALGECDGTGTTTELSFDW